MNVPIILNVDSSSETRDAVSRVLSLGAVDVYEAATAAEALTAAQKLRPQLVVVAPTLEDMSGADLCLELGARLPALRILRLPADGGSHFRSPDPPAEACVPDPVSAEVLGTVARSLLRLITAERRFEALTLQLAAANEELRLCLSRTSHDLSEPLRAASTFVEMVRISEQTNLTAAESRYGDHVLHEVQRGRQLLTDLSAYGHACSRSGGSHRSFHLRGPLLAARGELRQLIEETAAAIHEQDLPTVSGDPVQLQQLLKHLLSNALAYRNPAVAPQIIIGAERESGGAWRISMQDNGVGIPSEYHQSVFLPFQRLHGRDQAGSGIGLALCRRIVESHGGVLWVESTPGKGSTFHFTLRPAE